MQSFSTYFKSNSQSCFGTPGTKIFENEFQIQILDLRIMLDTKFHRNLMIFIFLPFCGLYPFLGLYCLYLSPDSPPKY